MGIKERLSGNEAVATAMRQINPDVMPAYPITPSTEIPAVFHHFCGERTGRYGIHPRWRASTAPMSACMRL